MSGVEKFAEDRQYQRDCMFAYPQSADTGWAKIGPLEDIVSALDPQISETDHQAAYPLGEKGSSPTHNHPTTEQHGAECARSSSW